MEKFEFSVTVENISPERVMAAYWELENWPTVAKHVTGIKVLYDDGEAQVLIMNVENHGLQASFKSVRLRQGNEIRYYQPSPPPLLKRHEGFWRIEPDGTGTRVTSVHFVLVDEDVARRILTGVPPGGDVTVKALDIIRSNSLETMMALKRRMEMEGAAVGG